MKELLWETKKGYLLYMSPKMVRENFVFWVIFNHVLKKILTLDSKFYKEQDLLLSCD